MLSAVRLRIILVTVTWPLTRSCAAGLTPKTTGDLSLPLTEPQDIKEPDPAEVANAYEKLNAQLKTLHASLPSRTAFIMFSGHSDPRKLAPLTAKKNAFEKALQSGQKVKDMEREQLFSAYNSRDLEGLVAKAKEGHLLLSVKL